MKDRIGIVTMAGRAYPVRALTHEVMERLFETQERALDPEMPYTPARAAEAMKQIIRLACGLGYFRARRVFRSCSLAELQEAYRQIMDLWRLGQG